MLPGFEFLIAFENFDVSEMEVYLQKFPDRPQAREAAPHSPRRTPQSTRAMNAASSSTATPRAPFRAAAALEFSEVKLDGFGYSDIPELPEGIMNQDHAKQGITTKVE